MYLSPATQHDNAARVKKNRATLRRCSRIANNWEQMAIDYARWLATRDSIALPDNRPRVEWSSVYVDKLAKCERRIRAVAWGHEENVYNYRKNGRRGARIGLHFIAEVTVPLPHWDWQPEVIDETPPRPVITERAPYGGTIQLSQPIMVF